MNEDTSLREKALLDELAAHKAKSIARGKLLERFRCHLQEVVDHVLDEGDRAYFGSTNHFTYLKDIVNEMDMWNWGAIIRERPEVDPYAEMRALRAASEAKDRRIEALKAENAELEKQLAAGRKPDYFWDYEDLEYCYDSPYEAIAEADMGSVVRLLTGKSLPQIWVTTRVLTVDGSGEWDEHEVAVFDNEADAKRCWAESLEAARAAALSGKEGQS